MREIAERPGLSVMDRRELLRLGGYAGLGSLLLPQLALAAQAGPAADRMRNVAAFVERWVGPGKFPGIVTSLGLPGEPTQFVARGSEGFADPDAVTADSLFRIYSMTKPITGMAAMMLIEDGKIGLDQPLSDILPKFAKMQVQVTADGSITDLKPAIAPITMRHLITHTSGLGYSIIQRGPIKAAYEAAGLVPGRISRMSIPGLDRGYTIPGLAAFADKLADMPLVYEPGTKWSYSVGLDLMGRVIEVVSGMTFDQFLSRRIFQPCGMTSTWFHVPKAQARRLTTNHGAMGSVLAPIDPGATSIFLDKPAFPFGGAGLVSSPRDYDRFLAMLAGYGRIGKNRVMSELAVRVGTGNLLPEGVEGPTLMGPVSHFGAGGRVGIGPERGVYGWSGAAGTVAMVDMRRGIRSSIFLQFMPPTALPVLGEFQRSLYADVAALGGAA